MKLSAAGLRLIEVFEGVRLEAYPDPGSGGEPWTIGVGTTVYPDGRLVRPGDRITEQQAREYLVHDIASFEAEVERLVTVPVTQAQFDALVSLAYNVGTGALESSTLLRKLNAGDTAGAAAEFDRWTKAGGRELPGLVRRRRAERTLFEADIGAPIEARTQPPVDPSQARQDAPQRPAEGKPMSPFIIPALNALVPLLPTLSKLFKGEEPSRVAERNADAVQAIAERVLPLVVQAVGAPNVQAAVEQVQQLPELARKADDALRMSYAELHDLSERSLANAREFVASYGMQRDVRTVAGRFTFPELLSLVFIGLASLGVGYLMVSRQLSGELLGGVVTLMLIGGWTEIRKFWFGLGSPEGERQSREP